MPVRNLAPFVGAAIESIVAQSFGDFEFLILDDGSTDGTREILRDWSARDCRIRLFERDGCLGPAGSSNFIIRHARGALVARMDGDDLSHPDRLRRQVEALDARQEACLVASLCEGIDPKGRLVRPRDRSRLVGSSTFAPFPHGSIMFRTAAFERAGGYRADADFWEDLDLYRRLAREGDLIVLPAALYQHRASLLSTRLTSSRDKVEASVDRMYRDALKLPASGARRDRGRGKKGKIVPRVYFALGSTRVWAGGRAGIVRRLLSRGDLRPSLDTAAVLAWALWASLSPRTLRFCVARHVAWRDRRARPAIAEDGLFRWVPAVSKPAEPRDLAESGRPPAVRRTNLDFDGSGRRGPASDAA